MDWQVRRFFFLVLLAILTVCQSSPRDGLVQAEESDQAVMSADQSLPHLEEVLASGKDLWGEAAIARPEGPSYEFFAGLLPPLRYVNTRFRHYPIVLSAPCETAKIRVVSNGSGINARAETGGWYEVGQPVYFRVGPAGELFGKNLENLEGPKYLDGWLPVVQLRYHVPGAVVEQEVFAGVTPLARRHGIAFVKFRLASGKPVLLRAEMPGSENCRWEEGNLIDPKDHIIVSVDSEWRFNRDSASLTTELRPDQDAHLTIMTVPLPKEALRGALPAAESYELERTACVNFWQNLLAQAATIEVPETRVNHAWRALLASLLMIAEGQQMNYGAQNSYATDYEEECSSPVHALLMYGLTDVAKIFIPDLLEFNRQPNLRFHNTAFKLQLLARYYWLTRDGDLIRRTRNIWQPEVEAVLASRDPSTGLLPKEDYCGDISTKVDNLSTNASCWRGIRDLNGVLEDVGEPDPRLPQFAEAFRQSIIKAVRDSVDHTVDPPFVPIALFGAEKAYSQLTSTMLGSYWVLMSNYVLRSGVFQQTPELAQWIVDYLHNRGGLCMGMLRFDQHSGLYANTNALDDLYTLGYVLQRLQADDVDRALVTFYGKLAQGLTRDTFVGAEGTGLEPLDAFGRPMFLPPNSASASLFLWTLRYLLVQDWDLDDDGKPETLRLLFATPRPWLKSGCQIRLEEMPTAFGPVSVFIRSELESGLITGWVQTPPRDPDRLLLRLRLPREWKVSSATISDSAASLDDTGAIDLTGQRGRILIKAQVTKSRN